MLITISLFYGCKKTDSVTVPVLTTSPVTSITFTTATSGGIATSDGKSAITARESAGVHLQTLLLQIQKQMMEAAQVNLLVTSPD